MGCKESHKIKQPEQIFWMFIWWYRGFWRAIERLTYTCVLYDQIPSMAPVLDLAAGSLLSVKSIIENC